MDLSSRISDPGTRWVVDDVASLATRIRLGAVQMVAPQGFGYLGQALSAAEQVASVFGHARPGLDRLVCSPGHYIVAPFAAAVQLGLMDEADLGRYGQDGSPIEAIGTEKSPVVDYTCGSLAQGLSAAVGFALGDRFHGSEARTYALLSDGEMQEGQLWEAAIFAAHHRLGTVTALLDANNSQVDGPIDTITTLDPIAAKWESFGWRAIDLDGHDTAAIGAALDQAARTTDRPTVLVCRTSTVHGLDCLPDDADGHFIKLPPDLAAAAVAELTERLEHQGV
ncbi:MAG TPA: transketolase [Amycolatopsis sp.]